MFSGGDVAPDLFEFPYQVRMMVEQVLVDGCVRNLQLRQDGHNVLASPESGLASRMPSRAPLQRRDLPICCV